MTQPKPRRSLTRWQRILTALVVLLAMGLRFYRLDAQSFWNDEGNTARLVERTVPLIIEGAAGDIHPPGYYLLLHGWRALAGHSEFALRSYAAFCGVAMVAVAIALGRLAGGWTVGLVAGLFVAIHPLAVYYSQEARMYAQLGLVTGLTVYAATALARAQRRPATLHATIGLAVSVALGLYTQYTYLLALVGLNLAFGVYWLARRNPDHHKGAVSATGDRRRLSRPVQLAMRWILAHALGGVLFLPWAPVALGAASWQPPDLNQGEVVSALASTLFAGFVPSAEAGSVIVAGAVLVAMGAAALVLCRGYRRRLVPWAAIALAVVPGALIAVTGIYRPAYLKFLMMSVVPLAVAWALPFGPHPERLCRPGNRATVWRRIVGVIGLIAAVALGIVQVQTLDRVYHDPALIRDDYRSIAAEIRARGRPGDAIVLNAPNQWEVFTYYYGSQKGDALPVYPAPYRPTETEAKAWVAEVLGRHEGGRLFVLYWGDGESDPQRHIEATLANQAYKAGERWVTTVRLAQYGIASPEDLATERVDADLGEAIALASYGLPQPPQHPGAIVPLSLTWEAEQRVGERLKVFVHLIDAAGSLRAQVDMEPQAGFAPTTIWQPGDRIPDRYGLAFPRDLEPGTYTVLVGMYRMTGERLPVTLNGTHQGDALQLAEIAVVGNN